MKGYVAAKGNRWYAVVYEGTDPITGRERRRWHPAGIDRAAAEELAGRLAGQANARQRASGGLTVAAYLSTRWLPAKRINVRPSTWHGYRRKIERHIIPHIGTVAIRRLRPEQLERLYGHLAEPTDDRRALAPKTIVEIHMIIRRALDDAVLKRLIVHNPARAAQAPTIKQAENRELRAWTVEQLQAFLAEAAGHRLFPAFWLAANTGIRRSEVLGLRWHDLDTDAACLSINRGLVSVGYELYETSGKTRNSRRCIDIDPTTVALLDGWRAWQTAEHAAVGSQPPAYMFTNPDGGPIHPHSLSQTFDRIVRRCDIPRIRLHDLRHTHATLLLKAGVPTKVVTERLGHSKPAFTLATYQHILPGMQAEAAATFAALIAPAQNADPEPQSASTG